MFRYILLTLMVMFEAGELLAKSPNFIILYADDLGYADTSVQMMDSDPSTRHPFIQTPGLERLAAIGRRFVAASAPSLTGSG